MTFNQIMALVFFCWVNVYVILAAKSQTKQESSLFSILAVTLSLGILALGIFGGK